MTATRSAATVAGIAITELDPGEVRCCPVSHTTTKMVATLAAISRATITVDISTGEPSGTSSYYPYVLVLPIRARFDTGQCVFGRGGRGEPAFCSTSEGVPAPRSRWRLDPRERAQPIPTSWRARTDRL